MTQRANSDEPVKLERPTAEDFETVALFCESAANNPNKHDAQHKLAAAMLRIANLAAPLEDK